MRKRASHRLTSDGIYIGPDFVTAFLRGETLGGQSSLKRLRLKASAIYAAYGEFLIAIEDSVYVMALDGDSMGGRMESQPESLDGTAKWETSEARAFDYEVETAQQEMVFA